MIGQEEFVSGKRRGIALAAQIGSVAVQQGMKYRSRQPSRGASAGLFRAGRRIDPIALFCEWIHRQTDAPRLRLTVKPVPIEVPPLDPQIEQPRKLSLGNPL